MAVGEKRNTGVISQVSWTDGTAQDVYYGLEHSFQYASNINCDDELHGIKLSNRADHTDSYSKCHLISCGEHGVMAIPVDGEVTTEGIKIRQFHYKGYYENNKWDETSSLAGVRRMGSEFDYVPGVVFQDKIWYGNNYNNESGGSVSSRGIISRIDIQGTNNREDFLPFDHNDYTDEAIETPEQYEERMSGNITAILNYNNTRLVVAAGTDIWVYYPELDGRQKADSSGQFDPDGTFYGVTGWKKVLHFEAGTTIVGLTCTFEYLKVWCVDEGWNTKVYFYQGNNNLRSTFVYNIIDLTGERVLHVYSVNSVDFFTTSIDGTDGYINLNKMVGNVPVKLFTQRAGLTSYDINTKAPYFVGPTGLDAPYKSGKFYIADVYGVFQFTRTPESVDKGYMKWKLRDSTTYGDNQPYQIYGVCENQGFLYVSDSLGCRVMRLYDTGVDGYQEEGVLISRQYEGQYGGTITKMLDEIRLNYEMNPMTTSNGTIDVYVSPNNLWKSTSPEGTGLPKKIEDYTDDDYDGWFHVLHITQNSAGTRTEKSSLFNSLGPSSDSAFKFDWQTITYAIVINRGGQSEATPIVRQIDINYHTKDKTNNVYDIN